MFGGGATPQTFHRVVLSPRFFISKPAPRGLCVALRDSIQIQP
jgi:hypothetical protein